MPGTFNQNLCQIASAAEASVESIRWQVIDGHRGVLVLIHSPQPLSTATLTRIRDEIKKSPRDVRIVKIDTRLSATYSN